MICGSCRRSEAPRDVWPLTRTRRSGSRTARASFTSVARKVTAPSWRFRPEAVRHARSSGASSPHGNGIGSPALQTAGGSPSRIRWRGILLMPSAGGKPHPVVPNGFGHAWDASSRLYFVTANPQGGTALQFVAIDSNEGILRGVPRTIGLVTGSLWELAASAERPPDRRFRGGGVPASHAPCSHARWSLALGRRGTAIRGPRHRRLSGRLARQPAGGVRQRHSRAYRRSGSWISRPASGAGCSFRAKTSAQTGPAWMPDGRHIVLSRLMDVQRRDELARRRRRQRRRGDPDPHGATRAWVGCSPRRRTARASFTRRRTTTASSRSSAWIWRAASPTPDHGRPGQQVRHRHLARRPDDGRHRDSRGRHPALPHRDRRRSDATADDRLRAHAAPVLLAGREVDLRPAEPPQHLPRSGERRRSRAGDPLPRRRPVSRGADDLARRALSLLLPRQRRLVALAGHRRGRRALTPTPPPEPAVP